MSYDPPYPDDWASDPGPAQRPAPRGRARQPNRGGRSRQAQRDDDRGQYVEVRDRVIQFYERYPLGSIQTEVIVDMSRVDEILMVQKQVRYQEDGQWRTKTKEVPRTLGMVCVKASAYRTPDDTRPATGHSWMAMPGTTPYTEGSELENAETSAVGRALAFIGIAITEGIASANEVRSKRQDENTTWRLSTDASRKITGIESPTEPRRAETVQQEPTDSTPVPAVAEEPTPGAPGERTTEPVAVVPAAEPAADSGLTFEQFADLIRKNHLMTAQVSSTARGMFPGKTSIRALADAERQALWDSLEKSLSSPDRTA